MDKVAVVILNYNTSAFLLQFLPKVIECSPEATVVVADNGSTDDSVAQLKTHFPQVRLLELCENKGYCGGYNEALQQVDAEIYVLLNSDVEVTPGWLQSPLQMFAENDRIAAIQPKILDYHRRHLFEYAGGAGGYVDTLGYPFCRGRIFESLEQDLGQYDDTAELFWASGACLFVRSSQFRAFGGFDTEFFAHMEEIDLCWRLKSAGYSIRFAPQSMVYHVGGGTLPAANPRKTYLNFRNGLILLIKNLPKSALWWKLPLRMMMDWLAAIVFLLSASPRRALMVLYAHMFAIRSFGRQMQKRKNGLDTRVASQSLYAGSILFDYHIRRIRKFGDLKSQ
jgi:GT2 family glycosyltransferase